MPHIANESCSVTFLKKDDSNHSSHNNSFILGKCIHIFDGSTSFWQNYCFLKQDWFVKGYSTTKG